MPKMMNSVRERGGRDYDRKVPTLSAKDRCDRCGPSVQARVRVMTMNGSVLLCGHHYRKHEDAIKKGGFPVIDEREAAGLAW